MIIRFLAERPTERNIGSLKIKVRQMDRKKELKLQYKLRKPDMGIFMIRCSVTGKCYLQTAGDLKAAINGAKARLGGGLLPCGNHPCRELQKEWNEYGEGCFSFEILELLPYDKDETKTDYSEELMLLGMLWEEKLTKEHQPLYRKKG